MPQLSSHRSVLDPLASSEDDSVRPKTAHTLRPAVREHQRPVSEHGPPRSRLSHELFAGKIPDDPARHVTDSKAKRFSLARFRNFSETHLAARAKEQEESFSVPPVPVITTSPVSVPAILRTAPTMGPNESPGEHRWGEDEEGLEAQEHNQDNVRRTMRPSLFKRSASRASKGEKKGKPRQSTEEKRNEKSKSSSLRWRRIQGKNSGLADLHQLSTMQVANQHSEPPSYGDESSSALAIPVPAPRFSESSNSDGSNGSSTSQIYGATTTTTHTVSTHTTFFKLPRRNKNRNSLFPLPPRVPPANGELLEDQMGPATPRASTGGFSIKSAHAPAIVSPPATILQRRHTETSPTKPRIEHPHPPLPHTALAKASLSFAQPGVTMARNGSLRSRSSSHSSPLQPPMRLGTRDRASTTSSWGRASHDAETPPPLGGSTRNSTSTTGRSSLGGLLSLSARFRHGSEPHLPRHGSPGTRSKSNSFALSREALVVPQREDGDTPGKYLERLESAVARSLIAGILSKSADPFAQAVLRSYTRRFMFFGEPIDMSLRKFLLEAELPKETQQVDRVIQAFADRYHECNPGIFVSPDQAYIIAFSLMMLHTDAFNKNNKRKMQKQDYIKNTSGQHVSEDVLACFYDNICYTPFIHFDEEVDINGERVLPFKPKKSKMKGTIVENAGKKPSGPVDPYTLLVEQKLDALRPPIKESITLDDPYNYRGSQGELDPAYLQRAFTHTGILQIISARSRPAAYEGQLGHNNIGSAETQAGIVDLKITKVGTLWRKAAKKKKARSPWQEWGAVLTGSQLYLFKNAHWAKGLAQQFTAQQRHGYPRIPVIFKPPLQDFKPDALIKTDNAVALADSSYTRHKHAFTFFRTGGQEEVLLADNESELNDWLGLINYAAAFRAAGVRIRGMVGGNEEDLRARDVRRLESARSTSTHSARSSQALESVTGDPVVSRGGLSPQLERQVMAARRQVIVHKIAESEREIADSVKQLDGMLRNARHLLILAPIAPRVREDIMHGAARADAMIKWVRRDIWRMKCHRDILAIDVQQDGLAAGELERLTDHQIVASESAKKEQPGVRSRLGSKANAAVAARSPPHSPTSVVSSGRPSVTGSIETYMGNDFFRTPPESVAQAESDSHRLPPLQLDVQSQGHRRDSISSTLLTVSSQGQRSRSRTSSSSSFHPATSDYQNSLKLLETPPRTDGVTPSPSNDEAQAELLARAPAPAEPASFASRNMSFDGAPTMTTPESSKHKGVRRSFQKTLRDHHHTGSAHKHRKGKESESTIRSGAGLDSADAPEGTPGLQREKGRFILHGKQASVIQFGDDWPDQRMKSRRDKWRRDGNNWQSREAGSTPGMSGRSHLATGSPVVREFTHDGHLSETDTVSTHSAHSPGLREDAATAEAFARSASPAPISSSASEAEGERGEAASYYDLSSWVPSPTDDKRQTIIGPRPRTRSSLQKTADGTIASDDDNDSSQRSDHRRTVIGPRTIVRSGGRSSAHGGADLGREAEVEDDGSTVAQSIDEEGLRRNSSQAVKVA